MKAFLDENFLLATPTAERLYHDHAANMPIIDYHCHLPPQDIAADRRFENLTKIWLEGDHYKWRAMRTNGVGEQYCTGDADDWDKFEQWAATVPYTMRNPLYHWTHLELKRPFGITQLLDSSSARTIYDRCTEMLQEESFSARGLLQQMNVKVVCTTDDPTDDLSGHKLLRDTGFEVKILPTFRPDKCLNAENTEALNAWLNKLSGITNSPMAHFIDLLDALKQRADYFESMGCKLSDHGLETAYADDFTDEEANYLFQKIRHGNKLDAGEISKYKSAVLFYLGEMYHEKGWVQQFHLGALRNNNSRKLREIGPDTGFDSIGDFEIARPLSRFLDRLDTGDTLPRTILYNLNPRDNEVMATMVGNFNDGRTAGKMQFGSAWWFLDQKDGMEKQIDTLSNMGLLSRFVGMLTDSRSFLSYPRHEYFRRILCNMLGNDVENGYLPKDMNWLGQMVENISYHNARTYFDF